jgi:hypothetical protein
MKPERSLIMIAKSFKFICVLVLFTTVLIGGTVVKSSDEVIIQSKESKTQEGHPVYNKIKLEKNGHLDIWTMKQSHDGFNAPIEQWDTIRIIVDKDKKLVKYQQLKNNLEIELKAACYTCHANGPRAIRPDYDSKEVSYSFQDKLTVMVMNLKIKSYGRVKIKEDNFKLDGKIRAVPLKFFGKTDTTHLNVKSCNFCHNNDQLWGRGELVHQQRETIRHLVESNQMPPWPFTISDEDDVKIKKFLNNL